MAHRQNLIKTGLISYHWKTLGEGFLLNPRVVKGGCRKNHLPF